MSLRIFHIVFVVVCVVFSLYVGVWGIQRFMADRSGSALALGILFLLTGVVLVIYGVRVFEKLKNVP